MKVTVRALAPTALIAVAAALLAGAAAAGAAPAGLAIDGPFAGPASQDSLSRADARSTWTQDRIAAAAPLEVDADVLDPSARPVPRLLGSQPQTLKAMIVRDPSTYPNRVQGKLIGTFEGLGDYSCSATVVSSGSGSLITSAGHCAYDVESGTVATNLAFVPGYSKGRLPFGVWPVSHLIVSKEWAKKRKLDYDFSMMRTVASPDGPLQTVVGSRGIGFSQPRKQRLQAYGYPARGNKAYDGEKLALCQSGYVPDPGRNGGPRSRGIHCDQQQGSSGGGWVAQHSFVVSNTSHAYPQLSNSLLFGPYYGAAAKAMYRAKTSFWPSVDPVRCGGQVATVSGSDVADEIKGTRGADVIATLGGNDKVNGGGGKDVICAGSGNDKVNGGGGKDRIDGGSGKDRCGSARDRLKACEGGK